MKKLVKSLIFSCLLFVVATVAQAQGTINLNDILTPSGSGWTLTGNVFTITGDVIITGSTTTNRVVVASGITVNITLNGATIDVNGSGTCAFDAGGLSAPGSTVNLTLSGDNTLISGDDYAGLQVSKNSVLNISGSGTLVAKGGEYAAGIGSGNSLVTGVTEGGAIIINSGTITATAGLYGAAGIGGGEGGDGGVITIWDGTVNAEGSNGAGIGGGEGGEGGVITIWDGTVNAESYNGAGIGGGAYANSGTITIHKGTINAKSITYGAGIGGGEHGSGEDIYINDGTVTASVEDGRGAGIGGGMCGNGGNITISGGIVYADGGSSAAGIGGGAEYDGTPAGSAGTIIINSAEVYATGYFFGAGIGGNGGDITIGGQAIVNATGDLGAGIGGFGGFDVSDVVNITIKGQAVVTATSEMGAGIGGGGYDYNSGSDGGVITISENAKVTATSNDGGAGIGGGQGGGNGGNITISDQAVVNATGEVGAGIGGGIGNGTDPPIPGGNGGNITISGQVDVTATSNGSAGIGGGAWGGDSGTILIDGGTVNASSDGAGAGIGGGPGGDCESITINNGTVYGLNDGEAAGIGGGGNASGGGTITIYGGTVTGENLSTSQGRGIGPGYRDAYVAPVDIYIYAGSTVNATIKGISSSIYGNIYVGDNPLYGGILNANGGSYAIEGDLYVFEGEVNATSDGTAVFVNTMAVNGGSITATSTDYGDGIVATEITLDGGEITAISNSYTGITSATYPPSYFLDINEGTLTAISHNSSGYGYGYEYAITPNFVRNLPSPAYTYWINDIDDTAPANFTIYPDGSNPPFPSGTTDDYYYVRIRSGALSSTALTSSVNPSSVGQNVTFTATVSPPSGFTTPPDGTVRFFIDGIEQGIATAYPSGTTATATLSIATLSTGTHIIVAVFSGDYNYTSSSATLTQTVTGTSLLSSVTTLTSNLNPSEEGEEVTFTATVTPTAATGMVQFYVDGFPYGSPATLNASGIATLSTSSLSVGDRTIDAVYEGNSTYASSSGTLQQVVNQGKIPVEVTGISATKDYDGTIVFTEAQIDTTGAVLTGILAGDKVFLSKQGARGEYGPNIGTGILKITFPFSLTGPDADKYILIPPIVPATITSKAITVKANGGVSNYGVNPENPGISATGLAKGETISVLTELTNSFNITSTTPVGTYILTVEGNLTNPNYMLAARDTGIWIVKKPLLVIAAVSESIGENETPVLRYEILQGTLLPGDQITGELSCPPPYTLGTHIITQGTLTVPDHYDFTFIPGTLTVLSQEIEISEIIVNGVQPYRTGNTFYYQSQCGDTQCNLSVTAYDSRYATVRINGILQNACIVDLPKYGDNTFDIVITSQYGTAQTYTLTVNRSVPIPLAFFDRFGDVLTVPTHIDGIGSINSVEWYYNGVRIDRDPSKGYLEMKEAGTYYALLNGSIRTCEVVKTSSSAVMTVYPNPAGSNQDITVKINRPAELLKGARLQLHNINGQLIQTVPVTDNNMNLTVPAYSGVVVVKLISDSGNEEVKLIVK